MGQPKPPSQPKERRVHNLHEVSLGFGKKQSLEEARRCPQSTDASAAQACPLGIDILGFIRLLREEENAGALERIRLQNPFPAVCGRICPAPCESASIFNASGAPIAVRALERYAGDAGRPKALKEKQVPVQSKKVAIIGSGPAGMSAAYFLLRDGYGVTIFEAMAEPGGSLRYGVPEFRLPQKILDEQFADLKTLGLTVVTNCLVGSTVAVQDIFTQGFSAVLLTVGAAVPDFADIAGHNAGGVYYAEEFLLRTQAMGKANVRDAAVNLMHGGKTVVVGSGPSAIDAARMAIRLGQQVELIFGGLEEELEAHADDVRAAIEEGVKLQMPVDPLAIDVDSQGFAKAVIGQHMEVIERKNGLVFEPIADGKASFEAQTVILSHGCKSNAFLRVSLPQLKLNEDGTLWIDLQTGLTTIEKVFAAGNVVTGAGAVVDAIASGKSAAKHIMEFLK